MALKVSFILFGFTVGRRWRRRSGQIGDDGAAHPEDVRRGVRPDHRGQLQQALGDRRQDLPAQRSVSTKYRFSRLLISICPIQMLNH